MSLTTISENVARFLGVFGLFTVLTLLGVGIWQAATLGGVYDAIEPSQLDEAGNPDPAAIGDAQVREDLQNVQTVEGWMQPVGLLGLGSILTSIILTFAIVIYRGVKTMGTAFPEFWKAYLAETTGRGVEVEDRVEDDVPLPFGGGT